MALISNVSDTVFIATNSRDLGPAVNTANSYGNVYGSSKSLSGNIAEAFNAASGISYSGTNGVLLGADGILEYVYEPAVDGGAIGNVLLRGIPIPPNFLIEDASFYVDTALVGSGASISVGTALFTVNGETITLGAVTGANLYAATAITTSGTVGKKQGIPDFATASDAILVAAKCLPVIVISGANLTAGRLTLALRGRKVK